MEVDPYPNRTPCFFEGCTLSAEEHHRINRGLRAEISTLKEKARKPEADAPDLSTIPDADLIAELAYRLEDRR